MSKAGVWGGQLEMKALAENLKFNVIIYGVDKEDITQEFNSPMGSVPTLRLSFHLDKHYNSVRANSDKDINIDAEKQEKINDPADSELKHEIADISLNQKDQV